MRIILIKSIICVLALCSAASVSYAAGFCSSPEEKALPAPVTKKESLRQRLSMTRRLSVTMGHYLALTFNTFEQRGIKFISCQFLDRNNVLMVETPNLSECFTEKFYHDLNFKQNGTLRVVVANDKEQATWTNINWQHAKLKAKTDEVGFRKKIAQKLKRSRWLHLYKNALNHQIEINLDTPITFEVQNMAFPVLNSVRKLELNMHVDNETGHLIGGLKITDQLGELTGQMKSDFNIAGQIKNELLKRKCIPSYFEYNEFKFAGVINRVEFDNPAFDQLPPIVIEGKN